MRGGTGTFGEGATGSSADGIVASMFSLRLPRRTGAHPLCIGTPLLLGNVAFAQPCARHCRFHAQPQIAPPGRCPSALHWHAAAPRKRSLCIALRAALSLPRSASDCPAGQVPIRSALVRRCSLET